MNSAWHRGVYSAYSDLSRCSVTPTKYGTWGDDGRCGKCGVFDDLAPKLKIAVPTSAVWALSLLPQQKRAWSATVSPPAAHGR